MNSKTLKISEYIFDASAKTLTFVAVPDSVVIVVNNTKNNEVLYNFACEDFAGVLAGTVLTFDVDTTAMDDGDVLTVVVEERVNAQQPFSVALFDSQTASRQIVDLNGAAKFGEAIILAGDAFGGKEPNALQWDTEFVGSGSSIVLPGTQRLETGAVADSEARFQSTKTARFMISQFNIYHGGIFLDNIADADCVRTWGVYDPIAATPNGIFFRVDGGDWYLGTVKDGVETLTAQVDWNGVSKDLFNAAPGLSVYEIQYNAGAIFFFQGVNLIHVASVAASAGTYASSYNFRLGLEVVNNNGNTTNNGIEFRAHGVYRLGEERGVTISRTFTGVANLIKTGAGYCSNAYLSRNGSAGGSGTLTVYDGVDNTGIEMGKIDIAGDNSRGIPINSTFSDGLFIEISGSGTNTATMGFE